MAKKTINSQNGFASATLVLLMFTIVVAAWFALTNDMDAVKGELRMVIDEMVSVFR